MSSEQENTVEFLTVEEAARLLRIGRTKAYALTQEWRTSGGRSGLPVLDLGDVLRVPRQAIEQLVRDAMSSTVPDRSAPARDARRRHRSRASKANERAGQFSLFDPPSPAA